MFRLTGLFLWFFPQDLLALHLDACLDVSSDRVRMKRGMGCGEAKRDGTPAVQLPT